tara:strand:+ start:20 stop:451 length:432 start_codon:yes stop_codon:yes gene_type:complete
MDFQTSVKTCFKKYATFSGRASRSEFWYFYLFNYGLYAILIISALNISFIFFWFFFGFFLATFIPFLAATARRLHDINKSGWFQILPLPFSFFDRLLERSSQEGLSILIGLISIGLYIYLLVLYCTKGEKKKNKYGKPIKFKR